MTESFMSFLALIIALVALMNWAAGKRSIFGRPMEIRTEPFWVACRWLGVGFYLCSTFQKEAIVDGGGVVSLIVAVIFAVGCSRRYVPERVMSDDQKSKVDDSIGVTDSVKI